MTIAASNLTNAGALNSSATSYVTASISPAANALVIISISSQAAATANTPTVTGASGTWVLIGTRIDASNTRRVTMLRDQSASPGSGALTIDFAGQTQTNCVWSVDSFTGTIVDTANHGAAAIVQNVGNSTTSGATTSFLITLAAFKSSANMAYGQVRNNTAGAITVGSGFTELSQCTGIRVDTEYKLNDNTVDWSWSSQTVISVGLAIEIKDNVPSYEDVNGSDAPNTAALRARYDNGKTSLAATTQAVMPIFIPTVPAVTPSTYFFPRINELPLARDYRTALESTTHPTFPLAFRTAVTPSTYFFPKIQPKRIDPDVIGTSLRATTRPIWPQGPPSVLYDPAAVTLFAAMATQPSDARKALYNAIIVALKAAGVWTRIDVLYLEAVETAQQASLNWKSPGTFTTTDTGTPTFTVDRGITGVDSTSYKNTGFVPSTNAVQYTLNDRSAFAWSLTNTRVNGEFLFIDQGGTSGRCANDPWQLSFDRSSATLNTPGGGTSVTSPGGADGLFVWTGTSSTTFDCWRNTTLFGSPSQTTAALPTVAMTFGGCSRTVAMFGMGASLTSQNISDLRDAFLNYLNGIGALSGPTPSVMGKLVVQEDNPRRPDYRVTLADTTEPVAPIFIPAVTVTPAVMGNLVITPDPLRADYSRTLEATTHPILPPNFPAPAATPSFFFQAITPDPIRPDYRIALASTTQPVRDFSFVQAITPATWFDLFVADDRPMRPDYSRALEATTHPYTPAIPPAPAATPSFYFDLTVQEDNPRRPDYSRALSPSVIWPAQPPAPPAAPALGWDLALLEDLPRRRDYSRALMPQPVKPLPVPPAAIAQKPFFKTPDQGLPQRPDYGVVLRDSTEPVLGRGDPCANMLRNPGFESGTLAPFWTATGPATTGVSNTPSDARTGTCSGFIFSTTGAMAFTRIQQSVTVQPNTDYTVSCWISSLNTTGGLVGVENTDGSSACTIGGFNNANPPGPVVNSTYQLIRTFFNSGPNSTVIVWAGYTPPAGTSRIQIDDFSLVPIGCDPQTPSPWSPVDGPQIILPVAPDYSRALASTTQPVGPTLQPTVTPQFVFMPRPITGLVPGRPDYSTALESTTRPVGPKQLPAVTPSITPLRGRPNDLPTYADYRVALHSTTRPVGGLLPPAATPVCAKWGVGHWGIDLWCGPQPQLFPLPRLEAQPSRPDYRVALTSTTVAVQPVFRPAVTPTIMFDMTLMEERPRARDYNAALSTTTIVVGPLQLPAVTPSIWFDLTIQEDNPRRADYRVALDTTCRPVTGILSFASFGTPSIFFDPPDPPLPTARDYRITLMSTTRPVVPMAFRAAKTPTTFFFPQWLPQYWPARFWPVPLAGGGSRWTTLPPEFVPPPPPPEACIVTFSATGDPAAVVLQPGSSVAVSMAGVPATAAVALVPGTATVVTLTSGHEVTVALVKNPGCP